MLKSSLLLVAVFHLVDCKWNPPEFPFTEEPEEPVRFDTGTGCTLLQFINFYGIVGFHCKKLPRSPSTLKNSLLIKATAIKMFRNDTFIGWSHLTNLSIDMNPDLQRMEPHTFSSLPYLTNLSISSNYNLIPLHPDVFQGLINIQEFRFIKNKLLSLRALTTAIRPEALPNLKYLDLSDNHFETISPSDMEPLNSSKIETLVMIMCGIITIQSNALSFLPNLKILKLSHNNLDGNVLVNLITNLNYTAKNLESLNIGSNWLHTRTTDLLKVIGNTKIKKLDLSENNFDSLKKGFFPFMPNLEALDLSGLLAYNLENGTLDKNVLPNLTSLIFSRNRISGFIPGLHVQNLIEFDLSENSCEVCTVSSYFKIREFDFIEMSNLKVLDLSKNTIYQVRKHMFEGLISLKSLIMSNCSLYIFEEDSFIYLKNLTYLDLSRNRLVLPEKISSKTFYGLTNLISLRLDYCAIEIFPNSDLFLPLISLKYLTLKGNMLMEIDPRMFTPLVNLIKFDISENHLISWDQQIFSNNPKLRTLLLFSNQLTDINSIMIQDFKNVDYINLKGNPIICGCELMRNFIYLKQTTPKVILWFNDTEAKCFSPKIWTGLYITEFINLNVNSYKCVSWSFILFIIILVFIVSATSCLYIVYKFRWYFRYWIFLFRQSWRSTFPEKKTSSSDDINKYDAFVSYSHEDRNFVIRLVAMLENFEPHFRLCVFERDFQAGDIITQSVIDCLNVSRHTILILSDSFAKSHWCQWELQMACSKGIFYKKKADSLIIVKLGEILEAHLTPTLRYLMKSRIYLPWSHDPKRQKIFWEKLRETLSSSQKPV